MKWLVCSILGHHEKTWFQDKQVCKECHRCGKITKVSVRNVSEAINYFKNYDKAINYCLNQGIEK